MVDRKPSTDFSMDDLRALNCSQVARAAKIAKTVDSLDQTSSCCLFLFTSTSLFRSNKANPSEMDSEQLLFLSNNCQDSSLITNPIYAICPGHCKSYQPKSLLFASCREINIYPCYKSNLKREKNNLQKSQFWVQKALRLKNHHHNQLSNTHFGSTELVLSSLLCLKSLIQVLLYSFLSLLGRACPRSALQCDGARNAPVCASIVYAPQLEEKLAVVEGHERSPR